jgi:UPF0271 protein
MGERASPRGEPAARSIDLSADLGEVDGDLVLLETVTSASIACGGHAGDELSMASALEEAARRRVVVGAHPSYADREHFGRKELGQPAERVAEEVACQVGRLSAIADSLGCEVAYVKLHGALYHRANRERRLAEALLGRLCVRHVLAADGEMIEAARARGLGATLEGFCDRAYEVSGRLMERGEQGALLSGGDAARQAVRLAGAGRFGSLCVHGDGPAARETAAAVRRALESAGFALRPFA